MLARFIEAEDRWLKVKSRWLDDHRPARTPDEDARLAQIDRDVHFSAQDLRAIAREIGGETWAEARWYLGKNFGHPSDRS